MQGRPSPRRRSSNPSEICLCLAAESECVAASARPLNTSHSAADPQRILVSAAASCKGCSAIGIEVGTPLEGKLDSIDLAASAERSFDASHKLVLDVRKENATGCEQAD